MKKKTKIIILVLLIIIVISAVVYARRTITSNHSTSQLSSETQTADSKILSFQTNESDLKNELPGETYTDSRSGYVFSVPAGYKVIDKDEYYVLYNPDKPNGCLQVFANSDYNSTDGYYTYLATLRLKERTVFMIDGEEAKTSLFDGAEHCDEETVCGYASKTENTKVWAGGYELDATFYNITDNNRGISIGAAATTDSGSLSDFVADAQYVLSNIQPIRYTGTPLSDFTEQIAYKTVSVGEHSISVPAPWDEIQVDVNTTIYRPPVMLDDQMQDALILIYCEKNDTNNAGDDYYDQFKEYYKNASLIGNATMQNPLIDNNRSVRTYQNGDITTPTINGRVFTLGNYSHAVCRRDLTIMTSIPEKNISTIHYTTLSDSGENINIVFYMVLNGNDYPMQQLASKIMPTFN